MKHLQHLNKYFWKYRWRFFLGILFVMTSNYFGILAPQLTGFVVDQVQHAVNPSTANESKIFFDPLVLLAIEWMNAQQFAFGTLILFAGLLLLTFALLRGFFMFLMRQTIIVMSRQIEFDQKNEVYAHYQKLDALFYKVHATGDLMSRMSEDVSRVRMYTGPALMYLVNLVVLIGFSLFYMFSKDPLLSAYVLAPLPLLAVAMYFVNTYIIKKSESIQSQLSELTTIAQESYSGIRVIKSFFQEQHTWKHFNDKSEQYRKSGLSLSTVEAVYFPVIGLLIGLSTLLTIYIGSIYQLEHKISSGTIAEFVVYINMLTFPVSAIGWVVSNIQRAAASQKRLNEFLQVAPRIENAANPAKISEIKEMRFQSVDFVYEHTGIHAVKHFSLTVQKGEKIAIIGKTGCGKTSIAQLMLRMYDVNKGTILINGKDISGIDIHSLRGLVSYVPQDVFLFSDSIEQNIAFGADDLNAIGIQDAAKAAMMDTEIGKLSDAYQTTIGERGVTLSGGQKQRISIARALSKPADLYIFDDCLSAVDTQTEQQISENLATYLDGKTSIFITHRIIQSISFDQIIVMQDGQIVQEGTHDELVTKEGYYRELYLHQQMSEHPTHF
ncbi:MAG: ABC transporter ATP-binding protein [Bacteroidota bacterium]|jgi:ATP-binding cassette subfamily B multidrug efflux pump|nr:ABC transporter ATP-binding protein/permease [Chitinophagaceae bacterium]